MQYKITSFVSYTTAEGERLSYTYSKIDNNGDIVDSNVRRTIVIPDNDIDILEACKLIKTYLTNKLPTE